MPSMWHHSVMAALTGDIYNMLQTRSNNRSAASSLGKVQLSSDEQQKENPEIIKPSEIRSQQDGSNDNMVSREVTDTGTGGRRNESALAIETALNSVRVWLGDDYQFTKREADALHALVINSEDPADAVSRFVSAKGINALTGMDIQTAYANLDQISEYWNGSKFEAKDISFAQKIHNGFARLDIMKLKDQWRTLDFEGKTDEAAALEAEILKMEQELGDVSSALPKNTLDKFSTWALENLGYTFVPAVKGGLASVSTTALGSALVGAMALNPIAAASAMGIVTATSVMAGTVVSMDEMTRYERGEMYWDYMHNYDKKDKPLAYVMSEFGGRLVGIIETLLDGVSSRALGLATGGLTSSIGLNAIARINNKGALSNMANAVLEWVTGGLDEAFLNELPEYFLAEAMDALYMNANDIEDTKTFKERFAEAKEQVWSGFVVGMIYGTFNVPKAMIKNKTLSLALRSTANDSHSFSEFIQRTNSMEKPEGVSQADWDDARRKVYETSVQQRNELVKGTVVESESIAAEELFSTFNPETGEDNAPQPDGKIYRSEEGKLYSVVRSESGSDVVYFGDKDTGAIYGAVEIVSDGNTQTVQQVRVRPGYEGIRSEMVLDAIDSTQTSETEIVWNPKTEGLTKVRDSLIENNPAGKEAGLRYEFRSKASDAYLSSTKDMIKSAVPGISDSEAMLAAKITSIADRGTGTISYGNTADMSEAQLQGRTLEEIRGATDKARSLIYVGQNSDFSTFIHELFHATTSQRLQESKELSTKINEAFENEVSKNQLRQFIADRIQIWGKDADVDSIMQNLSTIESGKPTWTISQEENLARLYEAYRSSYASSSQNLSSGIRAVLRKIAQYMNSIYQTLRQSSNLNKDIADAYDKLMGFNNTDFSDVSESEYSNSEVESHPVAFQLVEDKELLDKLESEKTVKAYRAMQLIDGKLYPPMAAVVAGERVQASEIGKWYRADENPDLAIPDIDNKTGEQKTDSEGNPKYKFTLDKGGKDPKTGKSLTKVNAAYNPYWHSSRSPLNDQFSSAYKRNNLVTVEVEIPESELTSGYKAEKAKDAVGEVEWKSGPVSSKLAKLGNPRKVILSRYNKIVRVIPDSEVASDIAAILKGTGITIPSNTVTPSLRAELENIGVPVTESAKTVITQDSRKKLQDRVTGDRLLDAQYLIDEVKSVGGEVDENGYIHVFHRTSKEAADRIRSTNKMIAKEDGLFFSTKPDGQIVGYGDEVVDFWIPAERLVLDDIFSDEAHLRLPLPNKNTITTMMFQDTIEKLSEKYRDYFTESAFGKQYATSEEIDAIKDIVYEYPKAKVADGVLMLEGLKNDKHDMPMKKEFLTAQIASKLLDQDIILLPRFMDRMLNEIAGYQRFDNYSLADGISGIASDGRTLEFKTCFFTNVQKKASEALRKADIAVIITHAEKGLGKVYKKNIVGDGEVYIVNTFTENGLDIIKKITSNEWRGFRSDTKSQLRTDNSVPILSIIQELQKVKNENQDTMDYEAYAKAFDKKKESEVYFQTAFHGSFNNFSRFSAEYIGQATENKSGSLLYGKGYYFSLDEDYANTYGDKVYKAELPDDGYLYEFEKVQERYWQALAEEISDVTGYDIDEINEEISMTAKQGRDFITYAEDMLGEDEAIEWFGSMGINGLIYSSNGYSGKTSNLVVFDDSNIKHLAKRNDDTFEYDNILYQSNDDAIVEKNGTLVISHELSQAKLKDVDALGGMPMPSLAISKPELDSGFGDVILLGNNAMANMVIDGGYVWNRDIWSPTVPKPEYSLTDKNKRSINTWLKSIGSNISLDNYYKHQYLDPGNISSLLSHQEDIKKAYLSQKGIEIETPYRNNAEQFPETIRNKALEYVKDNPVDYDNYDEYMNAVSEYIRPEVEKLIDAQERAFRKRMLREAYIDEKSKISSLIAYAENPEEKVVDSLALSKLIDEKAPEKDVQDWIYENIVKYYSTPYITIGNRKYEYNLMNIFKSMMSQGNVGAAENTALTFSQGLTNSYAARRLSTRAQMATEERLLSAEKESGEKVNSLYDKYHELATKNYKWSDTWEALNDSGRALAEYLKSDDRSYKLMEKALKKRDFTPVDTLVNTAMELADAIDGMSREYFEAKPSHIMKLSDFSVALIPDNATEETVSILNKAGLQTSVYDRSKRSTAIQDYLDSDEYMKSQILFQDQDELTDFFDGISDIDEAIDLTESIGGPDYELSADDMGGNWDWEIPQDWNAIYDMDAVDEEEYIQEQAPTVEAGDKTILAPVLNSDGVLYIEGTQDLELDWKSFVDKNRPEIEYTGTEEQKDAIFRKAIEDEVVLRRYLAIMGEALLHNTYSTNAFNEESYNHAYDRYETVKRTEPFVDEAYRTSLMQRLMKQVVDSDVRKAVAYALDSKEWPKTTNLKKKVIKEMGSNARFYRNIIAPLISDKDMLPEVLIDNGGLQLPSREELDILDTRALADLASKARNEEARRKILSGDLRFGSDADETQLKMVADTIKDQAQRIKDAEAKIKELEKQETVLDEGINSLSEAIKERDGAIADAEKILSDLSAVLSGTNPSSTRKELNDRYAKAMAKLNDLNSEGEWQKRSTAKGARDKGKRMGARLGTQEYMSELRGMYPELFTTLDKDGNETYLSWTGKRTSDDKQIRLNIEAERVRLQEELKEIRLGLLRSATRIIGANSAKMTTALKDIRNISSGDSTVIPTSDYEKLYEGEKSLQRQISRSYRMIENRNSKISDLNKEITELRRSLRSATAAASRADSRTEFIKEKSKENLQRQKQALLEASSEEKKQMKENLAKRKALQQLRKEKAKIAAAIMAPVNLATTDYDTAAGPVAAIQALIDPQFRRNWVYDISENPMQATGFKTMTIEEAKEYLSTLDDAQKTDLFSYMPQDLVERLTEQKKPLNDWTLEELKEMALAVEALKKRGREVLAAKKDARKAQAVAIQRAILKAVGQDSDESLPGSIERMSEGRSLSRRFHSATFATRRMQELAQLLDGGYGNKGAAYRLLVTEKRLHQDNEARAIEKRQMKINPLLTEEVISQLSDTVEVDFGSFKRKFTVDQLGYIMLSQGDEQNKNAVAFGALLSESEKGTVINHKEMMDVLTGEVKDVSEFLSRSKDLIADDNELKRVGLERYDTVLRVAKEEIQKRGLTDLVEAIGDDFSSKENSDRLDRASIEWFNTPLDKRDVYLPIHRTDSQGVDFENAMADSLFNLNANKMIRNPEKGFTISRIEISPRHQKNIDMSLVGVWQTAVREQEHLIEFAGYIKKLRQVFQGNGSSELRRAVDMRYTSALMPQIDSYIDLVANPETRPRRNSSDEIFKNLRGQTGAAYLGWKLSGLVLQAITSPAPGFSELKPWEVFSAYASIGMHPLESIEFINSRSIMMKNRTMNPIIDEVVRRKNEWGQTKGQRIYSKFMDVGQLGLAMVDRYAVAGSWMAMYQRTLKEQLQAGSDSVYAEAAAIQKADEFILRTQPTGDVTELASLFRNQNEAAKTILQFQTSLNVIWNNLTANVIGMARQKKFSQIIGTFVGYAVAGLVLGMVQDGYDDDDETKDKVLKSLYWSLTQGLDSVPIVGSVVDGVVQKMVTGESSWATSRGVSVSPALDKVVQGLNAVIKKDWQTAISKTAEGAGIVAGMPVSGIKQAIDAAQQKSLWPLLGRN